MDQQPASAKVLFVDDEENILRSITRLFMDEPFEVLTATSGDAGLETLRSTDGIGVIVSDQRMPGMSGAEFLEKSREILPDAVRLVLTGYADIGAAVDAINKGATWKYLAKPWKDEELLLTVREARERYALREENRRLTAVVQQQNEGLKKWNTELETLVQQQTIDIQRKNAELEKLNEQLRANFRRTIESFSGLIGLRERTVSGHSKNVALLARDIATVMKLPAEELNDIVVAGMLHDIGKIGVSDAVLVKRGEQLTDAEREEYERHAIRGQAAVEPIEGFREIGRLIRHHHENVDGTGYPDRLKRDRIPRGSRVLAVADAFDKLTNTAGASAEARAEALKRIEYFAGTRYDEEVVRALAVLAARTGEELERSVTPGRNEALVAPDRLSPGMMLSRDICSGTGVLILAGGIVLDAKMIGAIRRFYEIDPPQSDIFIRSAGKG